MKLGELRKVEFQAEWIKSRILALFNHKELNLKGIGPRLVGGVGKRVMRLWFVVAEEIMYEEGNKSFWRKVVLTRNRSSLAVMWLGPVCLLFHVYFPFFGVRSKRSRSVIKSSYFSPKGSLMIDTPHLSILYSVVLKSPAMIMSFPWKTIFKKSKESQNSSLFM